MNLLRPIKPVKSSPKAILIQTSTQARTQARRPGRTTHEHERTFSSSWTSRINGALHYANTGTVPMFKCVRVLDIAADHACIWRRGTSGRNTHTHAYPVSDKPVANSGNGNVNRIFEQNICHVFALYDARLQHRKSRLKM